ncbi:unnamed protein product [Moneuplotes crassus]|uniref:Uncharacterized protein n=1 Tax=Euplotes crassus TaxID=5936 RepID=A0AAD1UQC8_EUPCR|nr:unnamed protein product [Moneuplotes crassus]
MEYFDIIIPYLDQFSVSKISDPLDLAYVLVLSSLQSQVGLSPLPNLMEEQSKITEASENFKIEMVNSFLIFNNSPLLMDNTAPAEYICSMVIDYTDLFNQGFMHKNKRVLEALSLDLESDNSLWLEVYSDEVDQQLSKDMKEISKLEGCPPAIHKRIDIEHEKYKNVLKRKHRVCKKILTTQVQAFLQEAQKLPSKKFHMKHPMLLGASKDKKVERLYKQYLYEVDAVIEDFKQCQEDKKKFSQIFSQMSELYLESSDGILPNNDYIDDEDAFLEIQEQLFQTVVPLLVEDRSLTSENSESKAPTRQKISSEALLKSFQNFSKEIYPEMISTLEQSLEACNGIKQEAIRSIPEVHLKGIMKSVEDDLATNTEAIWKTQEPSDASVDSCFSNLSLTLSSKVQDSFTKFNIHLVLMKVLKLLIFQ